MKTFKLLALSWLASASVAMAAPALNIQVGTNSQGLQVQSARTVDTQAFNFYSYNFGRVWVNSANFVRYDVTNTGDIPITFREATISGFDFDAYHNCTSVLQVGQRCWFEIRYMPMTVGLDSGRFALVFNENVGIVVDLWGEGVRF